MNIWNIIVESNTFNFIIMVAIFAIIAKKMNITVLINNIKQSIIDKINRADSNKAEAQERFSNAKKLTKNIDKDIKNNIDNAMKKADAIEAQIIAEAESKVNYLKKNAESVIKSEEKLIENNIINNTIKISSELAKEKIIAALNSNPELHNKYIEESIKAIR